MCSYKWAYKSPNMSYKYGYPTYKPTYHYPPSRHSSAPCGGEDMHIQLKVCAEFEQKCGHRTLHAARALFVRNVWGCASRDLSSCVERRQWGEKGRGKAKLGCYALFHTTLTTPEPQTPHTRASVLNPEPSQPKEPYPESPIPLN